MAGIIPAGAGLTGISKLPMWQIRDHPRGCGAHRVAKSGMAVLTGSSPRVRGSRELVAYFLYGSGIIPAGAGLTWTAIRGAACAKDHPRGCGAHLCRTTRLSSAAGSSPRVRGSHPTTSQPSCFRGIIPAGAGLTQGWRYPGRWVWDHPRGCGAHRQNRPDSISCKGSSPRVRGSQVRLISLIEAHGIIPAGAGFTVGVVANRSYSWDHPRGCGAHSNFIDKIRLQRGSSPRVRGSPFRTYATNPRPGIIPAGAGLTTDRMARRDHPRGCGAHIQTRTIAMTPMGSSPRVRGSLSRIHAG